MKFHLMKAAVAAGILGMAMPAMGQYAQSSGSGQQTSLNNNGSFSINLRNQKINQQQLEKALPGILGLSGQNSLKETGSNQDNFGLTHITYQQYFKGFPVQDGMVLLHLKDGLVTSVNGTVLAIPDDCPMPAQKITADNALSMAQKFMGIEDLMRQYPAELVMMRNKTGENNSFVLAWKVRVDGKNQDGHIRMEQVFINAATGSLINAVSLITDADVTANAETLYRGQKQITADSYNGKFRLRDNARKIETYNASGQELLPDSSGPFQQRIDYFDNDLDWGKIKVLSSYKMTSVGSSTLLNGIGAVGTSNALINSVIRMNPSYPISMLTTNIPLQQPSSTPVEISGINTQLPDSYCYGSFLKIQIQSSGAITVLDSLNFSLSDTTLGTHTWNNPSGATGTYTMAMVKNPALDAHWGMEKTHDFYLQVFNRNSYDNHGSVIRNYINGAFLFQGTQDNAAALPSPFNCMVYGLGDGIFMGPVVGLDVMGHEFTHMVTSHNGHGGLHYHNESGALNESFSDMMGTAIEFYTDSANANWTIGEGVVLLAPYYMRSMSDPNGPAFAPNFQRQPDTYLGNYWYSGSQDNGGVHINSGVPNKWFYLLSEGGSGTNDNNYSYNVTGVGISKAEAIAYQTLTQYLTPSAKFIDAYNGSINAAEDIYGPNSQEAATVKAAWLAVGVPNNDSTNGIHTVSSHNEFVKIYPNPATTKVNINSTWNQAFEITVYSITGAKIRTALVKPGQTSLNVSDLSKGLYLLKYELDHQAYAEKLTLL